jgi:predicted secreted hydrolase
MAETSKKTNNKLGKIFSSFLDTIKGYYDPATFALIKQAASSSPSPTDVEVAWQLLGTWGNTGLKVPQSIPPAHALHFPADHGQHWDVTFEWHFFALSLPLEGGGRVSAILIFFRKAIATPACTKELEITDLDRQIFSTSLGITLEMPDKPTVHYSYPVVTLAPVEGGVKYGNDPFHLTVGKNSIDGSVEMFPLSLHVEGPGDPLVGRPAIEFELKCAAANPLFLQGDKGYVGNPIGGGAAYYYYSWPNQPTTGNVTIDSNHYVVTSGLAWMDHQWGGAPVPTSPVAPGWEGWSWCEFQFDGDRALTVSCGHNAIVDGKLPANNPGFGTYVEGKWSELVGANLVVTRYAKSLETDANYPTAWQYTVKSEDGTIELEVVATTVLEQQALWQGGLNEYAEAAITAKAFGSVNGKSVSMEGVGYCEGVGFEDPVEGDTRRKTWLRSALQK